MVTKERVPLRYVPTREVMKPIVPEVALEQAQCATRRDKLISIDVLVGPARDADRHVCAGFGYHVTSSLWRCVGGVGSSLVPLNIPHLPSWLEPSWLEPSWLGPLARAGEGRRSLGDRNI